MKSKSSTVQIVINGRFLTQKRTGVQRFAYEITSILLQKGLPVVIIMPHEKVQEGYEVKGWPIKKVGHWRGHIWEQVSLPLHLLFSFKQAMLVNFCNTAPVFYSNKLTAIHDLAVIHHPEWFNKKFSTLYRYLIPLIVKTSQKIITVSFFSKQQIEARYPDSKGKIDVIYNGSVHVNKIAMQEEETLSEFGIKKNNYILAVSSIEPRKNLERLIAAYGLLQDGFIKLVLVGSKGKAFGQININTATEGIIMTGYVDDHVLSVLYRNAVCFIYPSLYEGFGIPPLEAMNNNCPVIVSDIPSLKEIAADAVLYTNPYDIWDMATKMEFLVSRHDLREQLKAKGRTRAALFEWKKAADKVEEILLMQVSKKSNSLKRRVHLGVHIWK